VLLLDLVVEAGVIQRSVGLFETVPGTWLAIGLIFLASWSTGVVLSIMPGGAAGRHDRVLMSVGQAARTDHRQSEPLPRLYELKG
jgi:hypothetical protein